MTTQKETKLRTLLKHIQPETVVLASWLKKIGISGDLQKHYLRSGWLNSLGRGAFKRPEDNVEWPGAVYAMQNQSDLAVHVGAISALTVLGYGHYLRFEKESIYLFSPYNKNLPKWFIAADWGSPIYHQMTSFLPENIGIITHDSKNIPVKISSAERAIFECLYLAPKEIDLVECYHLMEGLVNLKPKLIQEMLEKCNSIKVKRLFLYLAEKAKHQWMTFVDTTSIDIGNGNRQISKGGVYISKYQITVAKELEEL